MNGMFVTSQTRLVACRACYDNWLSISKINKFIDFKITHSRKIENIRQIFK